MTVSAGVVLPGGMLSNTKVPVPAETALKVQFSMPPMPTMVSVAVPVWVSGTYLLLSKFTPGSPVGVIFHW